MAITKQNKELHGKLQTLHNDIIKAETVLENSVKMDRMYVCDTVLSVNVCLTGALRESISGAIHMRLDELRKEYKDVLKQLYNAQED